MKITVIILWREFITFIKEFRGLQFKKKLAVGSRLPRPALGQGGEHAAHF